MAIRSATACDCDCQQCVKFVWVGLEQRQTHHALSIDPLKTWPVMLKEGLISMLSTSSNLTDHAALGIKLASNAAESCYFKLIGPDEKKRVRRWLENASGSGESAVCGAHSSSAG